MKNQIVAKEFEPHMRASKSDPKHANEIRLKSTCLLASKSDISQLDATISVCYALLYKEALF